VQPDSIRYRLVYDAVQAGYTDWWFPGIGVALLAIALVSAHFQRKETRSLGPWFNHLVAGFALCWAMGAFWLTYGDYRSMRSALRSNRFTVVEGRVRNFQPSDPGDHREERWEVESGGSVYHYAYVPSSLTPGFRKTSVHGGPIREGLRVRIADVDGYIARLEVAP
jgi:hypothetical protein